MTKTDHIFYKA